MDIDKAARRTSRMWVKLGSLLEAHAYSAAESGRVETALKSGRCADACFWQATGDCAPIGMNDALGTPLAGGAA